MQGLRTADELMRAVSCLAEYLYELWQPVVEPEGWDLWVCLVFDRTYPLCVDVVENNSQMIIDCFQRKLQEALIYVDKN